MSNSVWPLRRQPTRLPCPWDSPGKNTGVGCHFLLQCMKVKNESEVAQSCPTLCDPMDCSLPGSSSHGLDLLEFPGFLYSYLLFTPKSNLFPIKSGLYLISVLPFRVLVLAWQSSQFIHYCISQVSVQFSRSVVSDSLRPRELQHARPPCPSPTPGVYPNPCPSSRWCHLTISSSVIPFSSCPQSFPASGSFPVSQLFASGGQSIGVSASTSVLPRFAAAAAAKSLQSCPTLCDPIGLISAYYIMVMVWWWVIDATKNILICAYWIYETKTILGSLRTLTFAPDSMLWERFERPSTITRQNKRKGGQERDQVLNIKRKTNEKNWEALNWPFGGTPIFHFWSSDPVFALLLPLILAGALKKPETHDILPAACRLIRVSYIIT